MKSQRDTSGHIFGLFHLFGTVARAMPAVFGIFLIVNLLHGTSWAFETVARQAFFERLQQAVETKHAETAYIGGIWVAAAAVYVQVLNGIGNFIGQHVFNLKAVNTLTQEFHVYAAMLPLYEFEKEETLESVEKARQGIEGIVQLLRAFLSIAVFNMPYIVFMTAYLYRLDPELTAVLLFLFLPLLCSQLMKQKTYRKMTKEAAPYEREYRHYSDCMIAKTYLKETRTLGAVGFFMRLYEKALADYNDAQWTADHRLYRMELMMRFVTLAGFVGVILLLVRSLLAGRISAGAFAAVFTSIDSIFRFMENIITRSVGNISRNMAAAENYLDFCRYAAAFRDGGQIKADALPEEYAIVAEGISFRYPNSEKWSVDDVSVAVRKGETVAIVGENGAGKSTLVKLLLGLYEPQSGRILRADTDKNVSAVFQDYQRYQLRLDENIYLSDTERIDPDRVRQCAAQSGVRALNAALCGNGFDTMLGKEFGGTELSGGQWQRVAIARGLYRNHDLIALDEPTSSVDPLEESRLYHMFARIAREKTAFIVTHRVGSARIAGRILVLDQGRVAEQGTHRELMEQNGKYAHMYREQAKWYE